MDGLRSPARCVRAIRGRLRLALHPHMFTVVERAADPAGGLVFDTGHLKLTRADPLAVLQRLADRVLHVHLKDMREDVATRCIADDASLRQAVIDGVFSVPGDGSIDFKPILQALKQSSCRDWLIVEAEQDPAKADPCEYPRRGYEHVSAILSELT
jgi:inosose dehydratase